MKISFTGDVSFTGEFYRGLLYDSLIFDKEITNIFSHSNYNIINLEGPVVSSVKIPSVGSHVVSPLESIKYLNDMGINVFNLANNHTFDMGLDGFIHTQEEIRKYNAIYLGAGEDIEEASKIKYISKGDIIVALIAIGSIGNSAKMKENKECIFDDNNITLIKKKITKAKENSDWVILNFHDGTEYNFYPVDYIIEKLKMFIDIGVDIIIGHHPHVPQGIEKYKSGVIFYSLGNFIFDLNGHRKKKYTNLSLIPTFEFKKESFVYEYVITESSYIDKKINITKNKKLYEHIENLSKNLISQNFEYLRFIDTLRSVFFNPILGNSVKSNLAYPLLLLLRLKGVSTGNSRSLMKIIFKYLKLEFIYKKLPGDERLSTKYDY